MPALSLHARARHACSRCSTHPPPLLSGGEGRSGRLRVTHRGCARMPLRAPVTLKQSPPQTSPVRERGLRASGRA
eukprot:14999188-Alexandrium_andersonii.AAC.1